MRRYVAFHLFSRDILHLSTTPEGQSVESWEDKSSVEKDLLKRCIVQVPYCVQERMIGLLESNQPTTMHQKKRLTMHSYGNDTHLTIHMYMDILIWLRKVYMKMNTKAYLLIHHERRANFGALSYYMTSLNRNGFRVTAIAVIVDPFIRTHNLSDCSKS